METGEKRPRGTGRVWLPKGARFYWYQWYDSQGQQVRASSRSENPKDAEKLLKTKLAEARLKLDPAAPSEHYDSIRDAYLQECVTRGDKSLPRYKNGSLVLGDDDLPRLSPITRLDEFFSGRRLKVIRPKLVNQFVAKLQREGYANGTINRSVAKLRAMFRAAKQRDDLRSADIPSSWPALPEAPARKGFFELEEYRALLTDLTDELKPLLAIGYWTGMRVGEIRGLKWEQVDFLAGVIRLNPGETKNDEGRTAPLTAELRAILLARRTACPDRFPFVCYRVDKLGHAHKIESFGRAWRNHCVRIGLGRWVCVTDPATGEPLFDRPRGPRSKPKPKMRYEGKLFHDLRRTGVRNLMRSGVAQNVAMTISGHKTIAVFNRYHIIDERDTIAAGRRLDAFMAEQERGSFGAVETENNTPSHIKH
jgi:integrase